MVKTASLMAMTSGAKLKDRLIVFNAPLFKVVHSRAYFVHGPRRVAYLVTAERVPLWFPHYPQGL